MLNFENLLNDKSVLFGVCSRLSKITGFSALLFRIAFLVALFTGGWGIFVYCIFTWIL